jgi:hypothetical protein
MANVGRLFPSTSRVWGYFGRQWLRGPVVFRCTYPAENVIVFATRANTESRKSPRAANQY